MRQRRQRFGWVRTDEASSIALLCLWALQPLTTHSSCAEKQDYRIDKVDRVTLACIDQTLTFHHRITEKIIGYLFSFFIIISYLQLV